MKPLFYLFKLVLYTFIFLGIFNSSFAKISKFNPDAKNISNYFSGLVSFDNFDYKETQRFLKKLDDTKDGNKKYSQILLHSLVNLQKYDEAYKYSKKLEKKKQLNYESNLFLGLKEFKNQNYKIASNYFENLEPNNGHEMVFEILIDSLKFWTKIVETKNPNDIKLLKSRRPGYENLIIIQKAFANCFLETSNTEKEFNSILNNKKFNFSRYNFFISSYFFDKKKNKEAIDIINSASKKYDGNLLINQFKRVLINGEKNKNIFICQNSSDILAEIFYIIGNVLSSQENFRLSNFYVNLSKFLNPNFLSYDTLLAENYTILKKNDIAKKIHKNLFKVGTVYKWYSAKQITRIMDDEKNNNSEKFLSEIYKSINPGVYEKFDFANFLRNKENYEESIKLYSEILLIIEKEDKLYAEVLERRGMALERNNNWEEAEKDLIESLNIKPNDAYVMNYLAYSWIEKNLNIDEALTMLRKANNLKKNNGYITDSLGWALFKSKYFVEAKKYLEMAIILMPRDPIINDHYADCLWMNNQKIQARYYWNNVLNLDKADEELKTKVKRKILFGLEI